MKYFNNINTLEELKKEYKKLAKQFHPDITGKDTNKIMAAITKEYKQLLEQFKQGKSYDNNNATNDDNFTSIIDDLIKYNITIDIVGSWLWIYGEETKQIKDKLKEYGFRWSKNKKKWHLGQLSKKKKRGTMTYNQIVDKYGRETIQGKATNKTLISA